MATKREMVVNETRTTKADAAAQVIQSGIDGIVKHNEQLMAAGAAKDELLMASVMQAQEERSQFWKIQTELAKQFGEMIHSIQQLKDRQADRDEKREEAKAAREMKGRIYDDVRQLAHVALNQATERPMLKESEKGLLSAFVESFDEGQVESLATTGNVTLRTSQLIAFQKLISALREQEDRENANGKTPEEPSDARH
jgi:hypothetical protein